MIVNQQAKNILPFVLIFCILGIVVFAILIKKEQLNTKHYVNTDAIIIGIERRAPMSGNYTHQYSNYVTYQYFHEGQEYISEREEFVRYGKDKGKTIGVRISKEDPMLLEDIYLKKIYKIAFVICIISSLCLLFMIIKIY